MKKILVTLTVLVMATVTFANPVGLTQAKSIAQRFMKNGAVPTLNKSIAARRVGQRRINGETVQNLYVFDRGTNDGFVIVAGNDALPEVIGYTEAGQFDYDQMPPALQDMLEYYSAVADSANTAYLTTGQNTVTTPRKASGTHDIATLMTSHWHQSWPYNNLCPRLTSNNALAITGCVATAASQIVYYWRNDLGDRTKYATPTYSYGDAPVTSAYQIPSGTLLKWDLMRDSYGSSDPAEMTNAAATLCATVGMSAWLTYGSSTSGQIDKCISVFSGQFGLNGGTCVWRGNYSQSAWERMIISDLEEGRPILYCGTHPNNGGHAVVVDGYNVSTNNFHFNFGWGGTGDGYYTVDEAGMNGYSDSQGMVYQIYSSKPNLSARFVDVPNEMTHKVAQTVKVEVTNNGTLPYSGVYIIGTTSSNPSSSTNPSDKDEETSIAVGETKAFTFQVKPTSVGTFNLFIRDSHKNILAKRLSIPVTAAVADLTFNGFTLDGATTETCTIDGQQVTVHDVYNAAKTNVIASFTNSSSATACMPTIKAEFVYWDDATASFIHPSTDTKTVSTVTFEPGTTKDVPFGLTSLKSDVVYRIHLLGTAKTNKDYPINITIPDSVAYFKLMGSNLNATYNDDNTEVKVTGNYNAQVLNSLFTSMKVDSTVARYDFTEVVGMNSIPEVANKNALLYVSAAQGLTGRNVVCGDVADELYLTPGYNFQPKDEFTALKATYHATQAVGYFGTAYIPFDCEVPNGCFAFKVNAITNSAVSDVDSCNYQLKSGTPYVIMSGRPVDFTTEHVTVSTNIPSLATDTLKGTWVNKPVESNTYILDTGGTQYFNTPTEPTVPALTAYLEYTKKVRVTPTAYSNKDRQSRLLAQYIQQALISLETNAKSTTSETQNTLSAVVDEAETVLYQQDSISALSAMNKKIKAAITSFEDGVAVKNDEGYLDCTSYITNPSFELNSFTSWNRLNASGVAVDNVVVRSSTNTPLSNYMVGVDGSYIAKINAGCEVNQTINNVPNGTYQICVKVAADYNQEILAFAGADTLITVANEFGPMYFTDVTIDDVKVTDGTLKLGAKAMNGWAKVDDFRLYQKEAEETGIEGVEIGALRSTVAPQLRGVFDISGRRVASTTENLPVGLYIVNGRKVIIK